MKIFSIIILGLNSVLFMNSCAKDVGKDPALLPKVLNCDSVKYSRTIKPIVMANCAIPTCHVPGGQGSGDFTTFTDFYAKAQSGALKARVIDGVPGFMPAAGRLPDDKIEKIKCWLNAGAPNN